MFYTIENKKAGMQKVEGMIVSPNQNLVNRYYSLENRHYSLENSHYSLENSHYSLENSHYSLEKSHYSLEKSHYVLDNRLDSLRFYKAHKVNQIGCMTNCTKSF